MTDFELSSRVAWLYRDTNEYNYGAWHPLNQKNPKEYKNLQIWIQEQNKKYPRTKYWIEMKSTEDNIVKNSETYEIIAVTKEEESGTQYTDWLAV